MLASLLFANVLQGLVALVWLAGVRRVAGLRHPGAICSLLAAGLAAPFLLLLARLTGALAGPAPLPVVRVERWAAALAGADASVHAVALLLLGGTALIFVVQEAVPALRERGGRLRAPRRRDPRLDAALQRVLPAFLLHARSGALRPQTGRVPRVLMLDTDVAVAALQGLVAPAILVSRGLAERLDDEELDAVVAHELAHLARGGTLPMTFAWGLRALQAWSPAALVLFRRLADENERACDDLAARLTGRPVVLASALLKMHGARPWNASTAPVRRAMLEVARASDVAATRVRVRHLLDDPLAAEPPPLLVWGCIALLGALSWTIA